MKRRFIGMVATVLLVVLAALVFQCCLDRRDSSPEQEKQMRVVVTNKLSVVWPRVKASAREPNVEAGDSQPAKPLDVERSVNADADRGDEASAGSVRSSARIPRAISSQRHKERQVIQRFDALTDKWSMPQKAPVTIEEVKAFVAAFLGLPPSRRLERIQRSLNLIPDENVILLAGVLLDKGTDEASAKAIFDDIINRDESVKKPILEEVYKDKTHSCWDDTRWIFEVTGETPKEN